MPTRQVVLSADTVGKHCLGWRFRGANPVILLVVLVSSVPLIAGKTAELKPTGYVNDFAHVLGAPAIQQLTSICKEVENKTRSQIAVVTIHSLAGSDIESYAVSLFKTWGIGYKSSNRGVLILLATDEHHYRVEVGYGLEPILPDGRVGAFGREAVPLLKRGDYDRAVTLLTTRIAETIAQDANVNLDSVQRPPSQNENHGTGFTGISFGTIVLIIVLALLLFSSPMGRLFALLTLFNTGSYRRSGGWGGGSWGGGAFGGGGGFGGFGGGSSGGGGASGSW